MTPEPELPDIGRAHRARVKPGDVIIVETLDRVDEATAQRIAAGIHQLWPNNEVLVLERATMKIVGEM